jgi:hypothetical protein
MAMIACSAPADSVEEAIEESCGWRAACMGVSLKECTARLERERTLYIDKGCEAEWDAVNECNAKNPSSCTRTFSSSCIDQQAEKQRCDLRSRCGGWGIVSPLDAEPIPCAYRGYGYVAECTGASVGNIVCACVEGPRVPREFDVYDCEEFLMTVHTECGQTDGGIPQSALNECR